MKKYLLLLLAVVVLHQFGYSQCMLEPISLEQRIENADLIVEGQVIERWSFFNESDGHIYTANKIEVYKAFKGVANKTVILVSPGGEVDGLGEVVTPSISLRNGTIGMFFLRNAEFDLDLNESVYKPYSGPQGAIYYDPVNASAADAFNEYPSIEMNLYNHVITSVSRDFEEFVHTNWAPQKNNKSAAPQITSITPDNVAAGINEVIEIRGSGFGSSRGIFGKVEFTNASTGDPFTEPFNPQYLNWTDTLIELIVPSRAGSGVVRVTQDGTSIFIGFEIRFAQLNFNVINPQPTLMVDDNQNGGFTWQMSTEFNATQRAKDKLIKTINEWRENTCINWDLGTATSVNQDRRDGVNNIRFGASGELSNGVLAHTVNYYKQCNNKSWTEEIDLTFDPDKGWYYGENTPALNQYDMESVAIHELGHAHQLGHVKDGADFMFATIGPGDNKRDLVTNNIEAGLYVMKYSVVDKECGQPEMQAPANCTVPVGIDGAAKSEEVEIYPNPFNQNLYIQNVGSYEFIRIFDARGQLVLNDQLSNAGSTYTWEAPSSLSNGVYFVQLTSDAEQINKKVILQR